MKRTMYAMGWIIGLVCVNCKDKPCPRRSWLEKNDCPIIIEYNTSLGKVCANCMHCVDNKYCSQKRKNRNEDVIGNLHKYVIGEDIFQHTCRKWTNTYEDKEVYEK